MTQAIAIDVNKIEWTDTYPFLIGTRNITNFPVFREMMDAIEGDKPLSDDLKSKMREMVQSYANAAKTQDVHKEPQLRLERIVATALKVSDEGGNVKQEVETAMNSFETQLSKLVDSDLNRGGVTLDINGQMVHVNNKEDLRSLFPELTREQEGCIREISNQAFITDAGSTDLQNIGKLSALGFQAKKHANSVKSYVQIKDGRVLVVSSIDFTILDLNSPDLDPNDETNIIRASQIMDITNLRGDSFKLGRASAPVPMYAVFKSIKGDDFGLIEKLPQIASNPQEIIVPNPSRFDSLVQDSMERGGAFQEAAMSPDSTIEKLSSAAQIDARSALSKQNGTKAEKEAGFLNGLNHSNEFMADRMANEAMRNTDLWKEWSKSRKIKIDQSLSDEFTASTNIYSKLEQDPQKRLYFGASKLAQYVSDNPSPSAEMVSKIMQPLVSPSQQKLIEKNSGIILRAATSSKDLPMKDRVKKLFDKISISVGITPKSLANMASIAREAKHSRKSSFTEKYNSPQGNGGKHRRSSSI